MENLPHHEWDNLEKEALTRWAHLPSVVYEALSKWIEGYVKEKRPNLEDLIDKTKNIMKNTLTPMVNNWGIDRVRENGYGEVSEKTTLMILQNLEGNRVALLRLKEIINSQPTAKVEMPVFSIDDENGLAFWISNGLEGSDHYFEVALAWCASGWLSKQEMDNAVVQAELSKKSTKEDFFSRTIASLNREHFLAKRMWNLRNAIEVGDLKYRHVDGGESRTKKKAL